jgi:Ca-activated chloride channel family protein
VVAPRYVGGQVIDTPELAGRGTAEDTDKVPDASRITPPRLAPGFDPKVSLQIAVEVLHARAGASGISDLVCSQHATRSTNKQESLIVSLAREKEPLDRDFLLRWRLADERMASTLIAQRGADGKGFGLLSIVPPRRDGFLGVARDVVFVVDRSGSMSGEKMVSAARACSALLSTLGPRDRFSLQAFDDVVEWMDGPRFEAADEAAIERGEKWLRTIGARGGTELDGALAAALQAIGARRDGQGRAAVVVLLTDGQVGDESSALKRAQSELGEARLFTVGIDTAVNDGFLKRLAALGGGTASFVEPGAQLEEALRRVGREIGAPLVVDLRVEDVDAGLIPSSSAPARVPDLFAGHAVTSSFRLDRREGAAGSGRVRVIGQLADGGKYEEIVEVRELPMPAIGQVWARARVADLEDAFRIASPQEKEKLKSEIVALALVHTLLTRFTAFVVVDESEVVNKDGVRRQVTQPVEMPASWEMQVPFGALGAAQSAGAGAGGPMSPAYSNAPMAAAPMPMKTMAGVSKPTMAHAPAAQAMDRDDAFSALDSCDELAASTPVPPPPAPPPQPRQSRGIGHGGRAKKSGAESQEAKKKEAPPAPRVKPILQALELVERAIADARKELAAGRTPSVGPLEDARAKLLLALSICDASLLLVEVPKFARVALFALSAALADPRSQPAALAALIDSVRPALEAAVREVEALGGSSGAPRRFWEGSI